MPDPPATELAFNLVEGEARLIAEVARMSGVDPTAVVTSSYGLEEMEVWGPGIAWNIEKVDLSDGTGLEAYLIDLYSGQVITYAQYNACWADLVALGGPFEIVPPEPSFSPGPGLAGIAPGKPYIDTPIDPVWAGYSFRPPEDPPFDEATLDAIYARVSPLILTANGSQYIESRSDFYCSQVDCHLQILGLLPNAADWDQWWFDVDRDGSNGALYRSDPDWPFPYSSVPQDAVEELLEVVAADAEATRRAADYQEFGFANWYPRRPGLLGVTYSSSCCAGMGGRYLTIQIDIAQGRVTGYSEVEHGG